MTTPDPSIDLLMLQSPENRLNALLEKYLMHHPDSPAREVVEKAIASDSGTSRAGPHLLTPQRLLNARLVFPVKALKTPD